MSQAYRPVILKDIVPASVLERADKNLKDANGYNAEIGLSGRTGRLLGINIFQQLTCKTIIRQVRGPV